MRISILTKTIFFILTSAVSVTLLDSCYCSEEREVRAVHVSPRVVDRDAYKLGERDARQLLTNVEDEDYVQENLLEIRARMSNIDSNFGAQSAVDYERGFTECIRQNCDSLARIIF